MKNKKFFHNKKVLVTGGTGLIGMQLIELLKKEGAIITVVSLDKIKNSINCRFVKSDLRYLNNCMKVCKNKDVVFHLAGIKGSPKMAIEKPASFMVPTIMFSFNMMEAAKRNNVKNYLFTSSIGVYAPKPKFVEEDVWSTFPSENDKFAGWAKRVSELQAEAYRIENNWTNISIVRPANVYGPFDNFDEKTAMVIPSLIKKALNSKKYLHVWGDGSPIRDFIYSKDVARGMMQAVKNNEQGPINLGSGSGVKISKIANLVAKNVPNGPLKIVWDKSKPSGDKIRLMDTKKAKKMGFIPKTKLEEGIKKTIKWYLKEGSSFSKNKYNSFKEN